MEQAKEFFLKLIDLALVKGASDIHLPAQAQACLRIDGELIRVENPNLNPEVLTEFLISILKEEQIEKLEKDRSVDFIFIHGDTRFRGNAFFQQRGLSMSLRVINESIYEISELGLPTVCHELCQKNQGLILIVGPTGHGKSTTLASMINEINETRALHIITVEDPVEFIFHDKLSTIEQRELYYDTNSFPNALKAAMRQDPDVLMVGELRDLETIRSAITMAETGHLVLATLHTNSAHLAIDRLIDAFPSGQQGQIRMQLSNSLAAIISQRLIPAPEGGRVLAYEVLVANSAIRAMIRDKKVYHIPNAIQTSANEGMISLDKCLAVLVSENILPLSTAKNYAQDRDNFYGLIESTS